MIVLAITASAPTHDRLKSLLGETAEYLAAHTMSDAREILETRSPDVIFSNCAVPHGNLFDILEDAVHLRAPHIILQTDSDRATNLDHAIAAGVLDCVNMATVSNDEFARLMLRVASNRRTLLKAQETAQAMRDKEEFNFALFQHNPSAMVVVDRSGLVVKSNLAMRNLHDQLPELGRPLYDPQKDTFSAAMSDALKQCLDSGTVRAFSELQNGDQHLNITVAPVPSGAVVIMEDISARVRAQQESERRQEQLIHADKMIALGTLVSGVAHEISNPNNVMLLTAKALNGIVADVLPFLDEYQETTGDVYIGGQAYEDIRPELSRMTGSILRAAEKIKGLVGDLKTFARPDADTMDETVNLNTVTDDAVSLVSSLIKKTTNRFEVLKDETLPTIPGNPRRIEQVIINLITNACQALHDPEAAIRVVTRFDADAGNAIVEVLDEGEGIPEGSLKRIQDPFFTTKHDTGGTGLGLSISSKILASHGGTLSFESKLGKGTTARMTIPVARGRDS